jgi:hypothetical protein
MGNVIFVEKAQEPQRPSTINISPESLLEVTSDSISVSAPINPSEIIKDSSLEIRDYKYYGEAINGQANGFGILTYVDTDNEKIHYTGSFKNNMRHGEGDLIIIDSDKKYSIRGDWIEDRLYHGSSDSDELFYMGGFKVDEDNAQINLEDFVFHGTGFCHDIEDDKTYTGRWDDGVFEEESCDSY